MCLKPYVGTHTILVSVLKQGFFVLHNKQRQQSGCCVLLREQENFPRSFKMNLPLQHHKQHKLSSHMAVLSRMNSIKNIISCTYITLKKNQFTYSVLTYGETVLSTNEPNPSLKFAVMFLMLTAEEG